MAVRLDAEWRASTPIRPSLFSNAYVQIVKCDALLSTFLVKVHAGARCSYPPMVGTFRTFPAARMACTAGSFLGIFLLGTFRNFPSRCHVYIILSTCPAPTRGGGSRPRPWGRWGTRCLRLARLSCWLSWSAPSSRTESVSPSRWRARGRRGGGVLPTSFGRGWGEPAPAPVLVLLSCSLWRVAPLS